VLSIKQIEFGAVQKVSLRSIKINVNWEKEAERKRERE